MLEMLIKQYLEEILKNITAIRKEETFKISYLNFPNEVLENQLIKAKLVKERK